MWRGCSGSGCRQASCAFTRTIIVYCRSTQNPETETVRADPRLQLSLETYRSSGCMYWIIIVDHFIVASEDEESDSLIYSANAYAWHMPLREQASTSRGSVSFRGLAARWRFLDLLCVVQVTAWRVRTLRWVVLVTPSLPGNVPQVAAACPSSPVCTHGVTCKL